MKKLLLLSTSLALLFAAENVECMKRQLHKENANYGKLLYQIQKKHNGYNKKEKKQHAVVASILGRKTNSSRTESVSTNGEPSSLVSAMTKVLLFSSLLTLGSAFRATVENRSDKPVTVWGDDTSYKGKFLLPGQTHTTNWPSEQEKIMYHVTHTAGVYGMDHLFQWCVEDDKTSECRFPEYEAIGKEDDKLVIKNDGVYDREYKICHGFFPSCGIEKGEVDQKAKRKIIE